MNLDQLRKQAKELKASVVAGDEAAVGRVLAAHPKYVGRPRERLNTSRFSLRDAQVTLARELGFDGWADLTGSSHQRWVHPSATPAGRRAWKLAMERGDTLMGVQHLLLALLDPPEPTVACSVLNRLGLDRDAYAQSMPVHRSDRSEITSSPRQQSTEAFAMALALGLGEAVAADEHLLLALVYETHDAGGSTLVDSGVDPDEVFDELIRRGVRVPRHRPPAVSAPRGPVGPRVYVPADEAGPVNRALREQHPPGGLRWGLNVSKWKPGYYWYDAEDEIDLPTIARTAVSDPSVVEVVPQCEAIAAESTAARYRYRQRDRGQPNSGCRRGGGRRLVQKRQKGVVDRCNRNALSREFASGNGARYSRLRSFLHQPAPIGHPEPRRTAATADRRWRRTMPAMATEPEHALLRAALPNYDIGPELGRGGWGVVYAGSHTKLGRRVAIKSLPRTFAADPAVRGRFLEEAQFAARLSHPHVVQVHDYVDADGVLALVMERMEPRTLWDRFVDDGVVADMACAVTVAVSSALHAAHQLGRAHLDVKPENVLFDDANVPKLSDFGVARIIGIGREHQPLSEVIGTPAYMSPEQARGLQVGPASDVYSTAVMAYELLAGRLPFPATSSPQEMLGDHVNAEPAPLSGVPAPLADAIMRALAKDPAARFATAEEFGLAIGRAASATYGSRWLHDSGIELRLPGRLLDGIQAGARTSTVQRPSRAMASPATQPHARLGTVLEPRPSSAPAPGQPVAAADPTGPPIRVPAVGFSRPAAGPQPPPQPQPPSPAQPPSPPPPLIAPSSPGGFMSGPTPPNEQQPGPSNEVGPRPGPAAFNQGATGGPPPANLGPRPGYGTPMPGGFQPSAPPKSNTAKIVVGIAAVLALIVGAVIAVRVLGGSDETASPATTSAGPVTTAGPVRDREGTVVDEPLLDAFAAACVSLKLDGDKAKFCGCARDAVAPVSTKKEIEAATAAFLGISGSIPPAVQAAMKTCTAPADQSTTSSTGP